MIPGAHNRRTPPFTPFRENVWIFPTVTSPEILQLSSTGITRRDPAYRIRRTAGAHYYVLECILSGQGYLHVANEYFQPKQGDVYLLPPDMPNEYYTNPKDPWEKIWFNVSGKLMDALVDLYQLPGVVFVSHAGLEVEFRRGMEAVQAGTIHAEETLSLVLHQIMYRLAKLRRADENTLSPEAAQLKEYLDVHWNEPFSLKALEMVIARSPAQTIRIFKNAFHTTPKAYHTRRKVICAKQYLRNTSCSVRMIADYLGFSNEFHFSNWFKLQTGMAPKFYRNDKAKRITNGDTAVR